MVKQSPKMTALIVSAIRNLREVQGSTPREILNYIMSEYNASKPTSDAAIQRKLCTALKRGLDYGILKCVHGHYCLNTDPETASPMDDMMGPMDRGHRGSCKSAMRKKPKRRARASGRRGCKSRSGGRRGGRKRAASGRKRRRGGGKRSKCGSRRKSRGRGRKSKKSRSGRRRGQKRSGRRSRRAKSKCGGRRGGEDMEMLAKDPVENRHRENVGGGYSYDRERSHSRGRPSRSRSRSPSHSRSSGSSDREDNTGNRGDRQVE